MVRYFAMTPELPCRSGCSCMQAMRGREGDMWLYAILEELQRMVEAHSSIQKHHRPETKSKSRRADKCGCWRQGVGPGPASTWWFCGLARHFHGATIALEAFPCMQLVAMAKLRWHSILRPFDRRERPSKRKIRPPGATSQDTEPYDNAKSKYI